VTPRRDIPAHHASPGRPAAPAIGEALARPPHRVVDRGEDSPADRLPLGGRDERGAKIDQPGRRVVENAQNRRSQLGLELVDSEVTVGAPANRRSRLQRRSRAVCVQRLDEPLGLVLLYRTHTRLRHRIDPNHRRGRGQEGSVVGAPRVGLWPEALFQSRSVHVRSAQLMSVGYRTRVSAVSCRDQTRVSRVAPVGLPESAFGNPPAGFEPLGVRGDAAIARIRRERSGRRCWPGVERT